MTEYTLGSIYKNKRGKHYKLVETNGENYWAYDKKGDLHQIPKSEFRALYTKVKN